MRTTIDITIVTATLEPEVGHVCKKALAYDGIKAPAAKHLRSFGDMLLFQLSTWHSEIWVLPRSMDP